MDIRPHDKATMLVSGNGTGGNGCGNSLSVIAAENGVGKLFLSANGIADVAIDAKSEGKDNASAGGCNANNGNPGRTLNANNAFRNGNDNYAGALARYTEKNKVGKESLTSRPTRSKTENEDHAATGGHGQCEYDLPYWGEKAESSARANISTGQRPEAKGAVEATGSQTDIWEELRIANSKRNLKGLRRFYESREIVEYAVRRCCKSRDTRQKEWYYEHADEVAERIIKDIKNGTYRVSHCKDRKIEASHPTGKDRQAKIFSLYDRCVQMMVLTIIEQKLRRKVVRNNYSNIEGRGIYCNDKRYCMADRIRTAVWKYKGEWVLMTDVRKFYESVDWRVMLGVVMETVKDTTTVDIIGQTLMEAGCLPIGSCLSPLFADILMNDYDHIILERHKPRFFGAFGDNRIVIADKEMCVEIQQFTKSYYEGRYGFELKKDYQIKPVRAGFSFCKKRFEVGFVRERGEIKRRAIKVAKKPESFAGYKGMLLKTDSRHLLYLIETNIDDMKNRQGMEIPPFKGDKSDFNEFVDKRICITNFRRVDNHKESGYYYLFQIVDKSNDGRLRLCKSQNGSFEIKQAGDLWLRTGVVPPIYVTVRKDGRSFFFDEYHTTEQEACEAIVSGLNIEL